MAYTGFLGTFSSKGGKGLWRLRFDPAASVPFQLDLILRFGDPSYLQVYGNELLTYDLTGNIATIGLYRIDDQARLTLLSSNSQVTADLCHITQSAGKKHIIVSDYHGGRIFFYARDGNRICLLETVKKEGTGPVSPDQDSARTHYAHITAQNIAYCVDLGSDRIYRYQLGDGKPQELSAIEVPAGKGPRHLAFSADERQMYVLCELTSEVLHFQAADGDFTLQSSYETVMPHCLNRTSGAAIKLSPDGAHLYSTSRGDDTLFHHQVQPNGSLLPVGRYSSLGAHPRDLTLTPDSKYLLICNQDSGNVAVYQRDPVTGSLLDLGQRVWVDAPTCLAFIRK